MQMRPARFSFLLAFLILSAGCVAMTTPPSLPSKSSTDLSHQYGEEILSYLMQVVLGTAGDPDRRAQWHSRGLDQNLDLAEIADIMSDPEGNKAALMVNDPNILGLSKVLYHYAPEMSQFTGPYGTSLYPATELVALRLFLLKRIRDDRKISIQRLLQHPHLWQAPQREPTRRELQSLNLTRQEALLLQSVFNSKPWLYGALQNPFLVAAFSKTGVLTIDPLTERLMAGADYRETACVPLAPPHTEASVTVAILPSITREFRPGDQGFNPTESYQVIVDRLRQDILTAGRRAALEADPPDRPEASGPTAGHPVRPQDDAIEKQVAFRAVTARPLVVYPENAEQVIQATCPEADFVIILLGRNVYQAMHFDPARDTFPAVNRIYLDITDVKHSQVGSEVSEIGKFIFEKLISVALKIQTPRKVS